MKCPVCQYDLDFSSQGLDEVYYDCVQCDSSLLLKNGKCEVLSKGQSKLQEKPVEDNDLSDQESDNKGEEENQEESNLDLTSVPEEKQNEPLSEESQNARVEESPKLDEEELQNAGGGEASPSEKSINQELQSLEESALGKKESLDQPDDESEIVDEHKPQELSEENEPDLEKESAEEKEPAEEEFFPDEVTEVPELNDKELKTFEEESHQESQEQFADSSPLESEKPKDQTATGVLSGEAEESEKSDEIKEDQKLELEESSPSPKESSPPQKEGFEEVAEFGNKQIQTGQGSFLYDLTLSEINSKVAREKVQFILADESLQLTFDKEDCIKNGEVKITNISPVRAYIIVSFLMGLPLNVSWNQHHIADSNSE